MSQIAAKITRQIESENRRPHPRWLFLLANLTLWFVAALFIIFAAVSLSVIIAIATGVDWRLADFLAVSRPLFLLLILPYPWIILALLVALASFHLLRHTNRGYRYATSTLIFAFIVFLSTTAGGLVYARAGELADRVLIDRLPAYGAWRASHHAWLWNRPEHGLLTGKITAVASSTVLIKSPDGRVWEVPKSQLPPPLRLRLGEPLNLIGEPTGTSQPRHFSPREAHHPRAPFFKHFLAD